MARLRLSRLPDWRLANPNQDIRGLDLRDEAGEKVGTIADLIVNDGTDYADGILLDNGAAYLARDIRIGDGLVYLLRREH